MINSTKVNVFFTPNSPQTSSIQSLKCQKRKKHFWISEAKTYIWISANVVLV